MKKRNQFSKEYSLRGKLHPEAVTASGITLIALIVTIIILLILAGVSLKLIEGGNGILGKAEKAVNVTNEAAEKEIIQLAYLTAKADYWENGAQITKENLKEEIQNSNKKVEAESCNPKGELVDGDSQYAKITFEDTRNWYVIDLTTGEIITSGKNGEITKKPMQEGNVDIWDLEDLQEFQALVNNGATFEEYTVRLMADIDVSSICGEGIGDWTPIGNMAEDANLYFGGNFEGKNHTISGIYINDANKGSQALFGNVKTGKIANLTVSGNITCKSASAGVVARITQTENVTIENCTNNVTVVGAQTVGGIVGIIRNQSKNITVKDCTNNADITATTGSSAGGIAGAIYDDEVNTDANIIIKNCTNNRIVKANTYCAGGIIGAVGYTTGVTIEDCKNTSNITANISGAGGILGIDEYSADCTIKNCSNSGDITATNYHAGGILGTVQTSSTANLEKVKNTGSIKTTMYNCAGGILGSTIDNGNSTIKQAYNKGNVYAKGYSAGGIAGICWNGSTGVIENSYNEGSLSVGTSYYGGIIAGIGRETASKSPSTCTITNCHNAGTLSGSKTNKGGIVGFITSGAGTYKGTNNYWLSTCGASYGIGSTSVNTNATKYSADQMKVQSNFADWDFDTIWEMDEAKGYPILRNMSN